MFAQLLWGVILPALAAAAVIAAAAVLFRPTQGARAAWAGAPALAVAFLTAEAGLFSLPLFPPVAAFGWLFWFALLFGLTSGRGEQRGAARWVWQLAVAMGASLLTVMPLLKQSWTPSQSIGYVAVTSVLLLAEWKALDSLAARWPNGGGFPLLGVALGSCLALSLSGSGSVSLGQRAGAISAALGAAAVASWIWRDLAINRTLAPLAAILFGLLEVNGYFYSSLPASSALLLGAAPVAAALLGKWGDRRGWSRRRSLAAMFALSLLLAGSAVIVALSGAGGDSPYD